MNELSNEFVLEDELWQGLTGIFLTWGPWSVKQIAVVGIHPAYEGFQSVKTNQRSDDIKIVDLVTDRVFRRGIYDLQLFTLPKFVPLLYCIKYF